MEFQHTISSPISFSGVGLHTGVFTKLQIFPAAPETGIVFRRVDLDNFEIEANIKNVARVAYATTLMKQGVLISTVEHLLSSLYAFGIDNALIEINNLEVPILDGSALPFTNQIQRVGALFTYNKKRIQFSRYVLATLVGLGNKLAIQMLFCN